MKVKYLAGLAAASLFGMTALTSCGEPADVEVEGDSTDVEAVETETEADPCAADPCAADPCAADPCAAAGEEDGE